MGAGAAGVDDPLRDAFVVEVRDLLAQVVVLQEDGAAAAGLERVVGVGQSGALRGGQVRALLPRRVLAVLRRRAGGAVGVAPF